MEWFLQKVDWSDDNNRAFVLQKIFLCNFQTELILNRFNLIYTFILSVDDL